MGLPFVIIQGPTLIVDQNGNITDIITDVGDSKKRLATQNVLQGGNSPFYNADVILRNNRKALVTDATVTVEQIFGFDDFADTWFQIVTAGALNNTWRIQIAAQAVDSTSPDSDTPAVDITVTVTAVEVGDELKMRDKIITNLNANGGFSPYYKASSIKDNPIVHISSKFVGEKGDRSGATDFIVTASGTATFSYMNSANQQIVRRGKQNSGTRDVKDRRLVTVGVSGEVSSTPGAVSDIYLGHAQNGGFDSLLVNGSVTPVNFYVPISSTKDIFINELRFYGNANGIKFGQFLGQNNVLTNGILVTIKSDDTTFNLLSLKSTDDFKHTFSIGLGTGFQLHIQAGRDDFMASFSFSSPFPLRKQGTFLVDDFIEVKIRDNLTTGIQILEFLAIGFQKEV